MVTLATERLRGMHDRAEVQLVDGSLPLPAPPGRADRFVATYVFDLFPDDYQRRVLAEAHRVLTPSGLLGVASLTRGQSALGRVVCRAWDRVWSTTPKLLGGCRPIDLAPMLADRWMITHARDIQTWGITSQVIVARPA